MKKLIIMPLLLWAGVSFSQQFNEEEVRKEIEEVNREEQTAFLEGDCDKLVSLMADDIQFYANGNKAPSKLVIKKFCENMPRPFKKSADRTVTIHVLSPESAYLINELTIPREDGSVQKEYVTKIWKKEADGWKMTHLHSTVKVVQSEE